MKKLLLSLFSFILITGHVAYGGENPAQLAIKISGAPSDNAYFLCIYNVGCLSIRAGEAGKIYPIQGTEMADLNKLVITDFQSMGMYEQPITASCGVNVAANKTMTIRGQLIIKKSGPYIQDLHCTIG